MKIQYHMGLITLTLKKELGKLVIEVNDTGVGSSEKKQSDKSIALENIKARLQLYNHLSSLTILKPDQSATVQIVIPLNES